MKNFLAATAALLACVGASAQQQDEPVVFRSDVSLVNVLVTVEDERGVPIGGLNPEDFKIIDEGEEREIAVFERRTDRPLSVLLLVDASLSTAIELEFERASAKRFARNLLGDGAHPDDRLAVMKFSEGVELLTDFTRETKSIDRAVERIRPESGTSMYDGVLLASEELERRRGRRVIILITDGGDTTSYSTFRDAMEAAHSADSVIYGLTVKPIKSDAGRNVGGEHALEMFATGTGGRTFVEYGEEALNRAFDDILESLRTQYLLGYYPPEHTDRRTRFRNIKVEVDRPNATILARNGYYVPEPRSVLPESTGPPVRVDPKPRGWRSVEEAKPEP